MWGWRNDERGGEVDSELLAAAFRNVGSISARITNGGVGVSSSTNRCLSFSLSILGFPVCVHRCVGSLLFPLPQSLVPCFLATSPPLTHAHPTHYCLFPISFPLEQGVYHPLPLTHHFPPNIYRFLILVYFLLILDSISNILLNPVLYQSSNSSTPTKATFVIILLSSFSLFCIHHHPLKRILTP